MGQAATKSAMTGAEFLAWEAVQTGRHEFVNGEVFAMSGAEDRHVTVTGNLYIALRQHLAGTPCRTLMVDMKLHVAAANSYFYPDVMVTCSAADQASPLVKSEPILLAEVLSPSTAAYDRGEKFAQYRRIPSLQEFVLIDLDTRRTDVYRKGTDGMWVLHPFDAGQTVHFASVKLDISAPALFAEVEPAAAAAPEVPRG
jgi:Uma2 family endonuclease